MPTTTLTDTLLAHPWTSITTETDGGGALVTRTIAWDSGLEEVLSYTAGLVTNRTLTDTLDAQPWTSIVSSFDVGGTITSRTTTMDSGLTISEGFSAGVLSTRTTTDSANAHGWASMAVELNGAGDTIGETITYDSGLSVAESFSGGQRTARTVTDGGNAHAYASVTTTYDGGGAVTGITTTQDSGRVVAEAYAGGVLTTRTLTDGGDAAGWAEITTSYDGSGTVTSEVTDFDDGQRVTKTFVGGQMTERLREDLGDTAAWSSVAEVFTGGQLTQETITNDDGLVTVRTYSGGVQTGETITDSNDIDIWDQITLVFNGVGEVVDRSVRFDNGTTTTARITNADPVAGDDSATTSEDTPVEVDVLANDSDADSDTLEITATTDGANGTVSVDDKGTVDTSDDTLIYTPGSGFSGNDSFTYTVSDGHGGTDTATVSVTVGTPALMTLLSEGFETDGNGTRYTTSTAEFTDGSRDFFLRTDGSNGSDMIHYAGLSSQTGSYYFGGTDLDGEGADATQSLTFSGIDISGVSDLSLSFGNAAWFAEGGFDYDTLFYVTASIDGGPATKIIQFASEESWSDMMGMNMVSWLAQDTNLDGTPDGTAVNTTFQTFTAAIAGIGSTLDLSFVWYEFDSQGDNHAIDDIVLTGTGFAQEAPELMTSGEAQAAPMGADAFHFVAAEAADDGLFF